jgi:hypothetical protein
VVAHALDENNGSLVNIPFGHLIRVAMSHEEWDIGKEWTGREITFWTKRVSLWDKAIKVSFNARLSSEASAYLPLFYLTLDPALSEADVALAADSYMMMLNLRRKEMAHGDSD